MKAVYSYWSCKGSILNASYNTGNAKAHLQLMALSILYSNKWFNDIEFITDSISAPIIEKLKLPIEIKTDLDCLKNEDKNLWALGKIKAYEIQTKPFIHIDGDVILLLPINQEKLKSKILFQSKEWGNLFEAIYRESFSNITKPTKSWTDTNFAVNMGIYACNDLSYNQEYCKEVFELVSKNYETMKDTSDNKKRHIARYCVLFEQFMAAAVAERMGITPTYLFNDIKEADNIGYVHLLANAKNKTENINSVSKILKTEFPEHFEIINKIL